MIADRDLCLGWAHGGTVRHEFLASLMKFRDSPQWQLVGRAEAVTAGTAVAYARNTLCEKFLNGPEQWMLMIDTDIVFTPHAVTRLARAADEDKRPVMSGLVLHLPDVTTGMPAPMIYDRADPPGDGIPGWRLRRTWPADDLIRVDGCGAGLLLIHRTALETIAAAEDGLPCWFRELPSGRHYMGDDLSFSARAQARGIPIWVDTGATCGHMKTIQLGDAG